jgi:hypothetical protein
VSSQPAVCITIRLHVPWLAIYGCVFIYAGYEVAFMYSINVYIHVLLYHHYHPQSTQPGHVMP